VYTAITPPCIRRAWKIYTAVTRPCTGRQRPCTAVVRPRTGRVHGRVTCRVHGRVHGRVTCRMPITRRPCTRPVKTSSPAKNGRPCRINGPTRPSTGRSHGTSTPPVYMTVYGPSARTSSAAYVARTRPRTRDVYTAVYTAVYGPCTRPCTRHVHGRVHVSTCLRVQGPCAQPCTGHLRGRKRPYGRVRAVSARVHGSVRALCMAVFGRAHWPCTLPV